MNINEAKNFLDEFEVSHADIPVRLVFDVSEDEASTLMGIIKKLGYAAHLQSSAYGDIEVVVTDGHIGSSQKKTS